MGIPLSDLLGPDFIRLFHDTYIASGQMVTLRLRARTIMKRLPAATHVSHHTAVRLWGGVAPDSADIHVCMASREARCRRAGVAAHLGTITAQTTICDGVPISIPEQAFLVRSNATRNGRLELHSWTCAEKRQAEGLAVHRKDDLADVLS